MNINELRQHKRKEILQLATQHGAFNIRVFGSVARNQAKTNSDIDFLVKVGSKHTPWFPSGFILDLEALLKCKVDVVTEDALHWYIREQILAEAIPL